MNLTARAKNIIVSPDTEWPVIAAETTPARDLILGYVLPLAAIGAIAGFIGGSIVGMTMPYVGTYRVPIVSGLLGVVLALAIAVAGVFILAFIINALAPTFGAEKNQAQALKLAAYSYTPAWIAAAFQIIPVLGILALLGALYGFYLLYRGIPVLMKAPPDKAVPYTAVVVVAAIVLFFVLAMFTGMFLATAGAATGVRSSEVQFDPNSPMGTSRVDGRLVHERVSKTGGTNEFSIVIADRFVVTAKGDGLDINALKAAVAALDLRKLESLKKPS